MKANVTRRPSTHVHTYTLCKCDYIRTVQAVRRIIKREGCDASLIRVASDISVGYPPGHPNGTLSVCAFAYQFHVPGGEGRIRKEGWEEER